MEEKMEKKMKEEMKEKMKEKRYRRICWLISSLTLAGVIVFLDDQSGNSLSRSALGAADKVCRQ